jgi:hypothetical protein
MRRVVLLALICSVVAALAAAPGRAVLAPVVRGGDDATHPVKPKFRVVVVDGLTTDDLRRLDGHAAVGLLVPGAGPLTNYGYALASLVRGLNLNASLHVVPGTKPLFTVTEEASVPLHGNTIVVSLPPRGKLGRNDRRYPIAVIGAGFRGLLTSPTTRIAGLVSVADVAPTALGRARGTMGHVSGIGAVERVEQLDVQIHANNRLKLPVLIIIAVALVLIMVVRPRVAVPAILAALLASLAAGAVGVTSEPLLVAIVTAGTLGGGALIAHVCRDDRRLLTAIVLVLLVHVVSLVFRPAWVAVAPLGPTQNSRFWGIGNQLETLLLAPVVVGASLAARRYGAVGFGVFSAVALVLITDNRLGSDGGGAIVFGVALALVGARSLRLGVRGFVTCLGLAAVVVLSVIAANLRGPGPDHLRSAFDHGVSGLAHVVVDRIPLSYVPALHEWPLLLPLALLLVSALVVGFRVSDDRAREIVLAAGLALATSLLVNDSAVYEVTAGTAVVAALARFSTPVAPPLELGAQRGMVGEPQPAAPPQRH